MSVLAEVAQRAIHGHRWCATEAGGRPGGVGG